MRFSTLLELGMTTRALLVTAGLALCAACADQSQPPAEPEWATVSGTILELGGENSVPEQIFDRIRAVRLLSDGAILVADGGSQQLRIFDSTGALDVQFGRRGRGPGEFQYLRSVLVTSGDSIIAYDSRSHRISEFDRSGRLLRELRLPGAGSVDNEMIVRFDAGEYLFAEHVAPEMRGPEGVKRGLSYYVKYDLTRDQVDTIAVLPGPEMDLQVNGDGSYTTFEVPFGRDAFHAAGDGDWFVGANDVFEIARRDRDGAVVDILRIAEPAAELEREEILRTEMAAIDRIDPDPTRLRTIQRLFREVPGPEFRPAFSRLLVDSAGRLWVAEWFSAFSGPDASGLRWRVFDPAGLLLGHVRLPATFDAHDAGADRVAGIDTDPFGVQRVVVLSLEVRS